MEGVFFETVVVFWKWRLSFLKWTLLLLKWWVFFGNGGCQYANGVGRGGIHVYMYGNGI